MWDSALPGGLTSAAPSDLTSDGDRLASSIDGPGVAATRTPVPVSVTGDALVLTPPSSALIGKGVVYPVYLDPPFTPISASPEAYVESQHPTAVDYNPSDDLRVGLDDWTSGCGSSPCYQNGVTRSYLTFPGTGGLNGKSIASAVIQLNQLRSSCAGTSAQLNVSINSGNQGFGSTLDWNNMPPWSSIVDSTTVPGGSQSDVEFSVLNVVRWGPASNYQSLNVQLYASNETDDCIYRHFGLNPKLVVNYVSTPNVPAGLKAVNGTQEYPCNTTSPGPWIPAAASNQITLKDTVSTADAGDSNLYAPFLLSSDGGASFASTTAGPITETSANTAVPASTTVTLTNNTAYRWKATTYTTSFSPNPTSPESATCFFRYDNGAPSAPAISSTAYPVSGPTTVTSGGSGTFTFSATDAVSGVAAYNYNINGSSISSGGLGEHQTTASSLSVALSSLTYGTNTLWVQAVDAAGNLSQVQFYNFFVQQSAFGQYQPGIAGDIDGDGVPDLVTVDAAGSIRLFSNPEITTNNPTGNTTVDPLQYGGRVLIPATSNARWPMPDSASAAGALLTHAGSYTGNNYDDLIVVQNGHLAVTTNPGGSGTWTFATTNVPKPACASCVNYNGTDWSSVQQVIALPTTAGARPQLLTVELVNNTATLWLYAPGSGLTFQAPTQISTYTDAWHWDEEQIIGAGQLPGTTGTTLWVREIATGELNQIHNIEAGVPDPRSVRTRVATGYTVSTYPLLTTFGRADSAGNVGIWATDANGTLWLIPTMTNSSGVTTVRGTLRQRSASGWASHEVALGDSYAQYNNSGVANANGGNTPFDVTTANTYAYALQATRDAQLDPNTIVNDGAGGCPSGWTSCSGGLSNANTVAVLRDSGLYDTFTMPGPWAHRPDNYAAAGQVVPAPVPNTSGPAHTISFLGAASTSDNVNGASVNATITYTNGHTQVVTVTFANWLQDVTTSPIGGDIVVARCAYRAVAASGATDNTPAFVFATPDLTLLDNGNPLGANVQIASITLGTNSSVHLFSIAIS
jgi:hypothetical protein